MGQYIAGKSMCTKYGTDERSMDKYVRSIKTAGLRGKYGAAEAGADHIDMGKCQWY